MIEYVSSLFIIFLFCKMVMGKLKQVNQKCSVILIIYFQHIEIVLNVKIVIDHINYIGTG